MNSGNSTKNKVILKKTDPNHEGFLLDRDDIFVLTDVGITPWLTRKCGIAAEPIVIQKTASLVKRPFQ